MWEQSSKKRSDLGQSFLNQIHRSYKISERPEVKRTKI
jgi:hypothetical protein